MQEGARIKLQRCQGTPARGLLVSERHLDSQPWPPQGIPVHPRPSGALSFPVGAHLHPYSGGPGPGNCR